MKTLLRCAFSALLLSASALAQEARTPELPETAELKDLFHLPTSKLPAIAPAFVAGGPAAAAIGPFGDPGQSAFQVNLQMGFALQPIAIPAGKRLVVDYIAVAGAAASASGPIQPVVILQSSLKGGAAANYYLMVGSSTLTPAQFYQTQRLVVYADALNISTGYAGYSPYFFNFNIALSGHLIDAPAF